MRPDAVRCKARFDNRPNKGFDAASLPWSLCRWFRRCEVREIFLPGGQTAQGPGSFCPDASRFHLRACCRSGEGFLNTHPWRIACLAGHDFSREGLAEKMGAAAI